MPASDDPSLLSAAEVAGLTDDQLVAAIQRSEEIRREGRERSGRLYLWHCSARLAAGDRELSDGESAGIARELLDGAGVAARDDPGGPRWFAVRHADDHIHIAVVLVRQVYRDCATRPGRSNGGSG